KIDRVAGAHLRPWLRSLEQPDGLVGAAVHRVDELQLPDAEIIVRLRFDEDLLDGRRRRVAAWPGDRHARRLIVEHVDGVLRRGAHVLAVRALELDAVEALAIDREAAGEG